MGKELKPLEFYKLLKVVCQEKGGITISHYRAREVYECILMFVMQELRRNESIKLPYFGTLYITHIKEHERKVNNFDGNGYEQKFESSIVFNFTPSAKFKHMMVNEIDFETRTKRRRKLQTERFRQERLIEKENKKYVDKKLDLQLEEFIRLKSNNINTKNIIKEKPVQNKNKKIQRIYCEEIDLEFANASQCQRYFKENLNIKLIIRDILLNCQGKASHHHNYHFKFVDYELYNRRD